MKAMTTVAVRGRWTGETEKRRRGDAETRRYGPEKQTGADGVTGENCKRNSYVCGGYPPRKYFLPGGKLGTEPYASPRARSY